MNLQAIILELLKHADKLDLNQILDMVKDGKDLVLKTLDELEDKGLVKSEMLDSSKLYSVVEGALDSAKDIDKEDLVEGASKLLNLFK